MKFLSTGLIILAIALTSCSKDGEIGPIGPAGQDGTNGTDGIDGVDGNANVQSFRFQDPSWTTTSSSLGIADLNIPEITYDIVNYGAIIGYINFGTISTNTSGYILTPVSNKHINGYSGRWIIDSKSFPGSGIFQFRLTKDDSSVIESLPPIYFAKVILINPSDMKTTVGNGKNVSAQQSTLNELEAAGVNIEDYHAVMDYYGLEH